MTQASAPAVAESVTAASCLELLRAMPAITQFRRVLYEFAPAEAGGWLGALSLLSRHPDGLRASALAELLHVDLSVASRSVTQLLQLGYARREADPTDGRASVVHATDSGQAWIAAFGERFAGAMRDRLDGWTDADVQQLAELLRRFDASLAQVQQ